MKNHVFFHFQVPIFQLDSYRIHTFKIPPLDNYKFNMLISKTELQSKFKIAVESEGNYNRVFSVLLKTPKGKEFKQKMDFSKAKQHHFLPIDERLIKVNLDYKFTLSISLASDSNPRKFTSSLNHNYAKFHQEKKEIYANKAYKYVGLPNQGSTCYLNSLLQVFFHLKRFRKIIYEKNVDLDQSNIIFCLKLLFCDLQMKSTKRTTKIITQCFGWDQNDASIPQDVAEFFHFFCDIIKESPIDLFEGEYNILISSYDNKIERVSNVTFHSILLNIEQCQSLLDSLKLFVAPYCLSDTMKIDDKYEGTKRLVFSKLPSVFVFQLKRFWFNSKKGVYEKLNSIYKFPNILDVSEFAPKCNKDDETLYQLFAIIDHIGGLNLGHYIAFINPNLKDDWYEFNDNNVIKVSEEKVLELSFGSKNLSAYMLFYVKLNMKEYIFDNNCTIPENIKNFKAIISNGVPSSFSIITEEDLALKILDLKSVFLNSENKKQLNFPVGTPYQTVYSKISEFTHKDNKKIRIWKCRGNQLEMVLPKEGEIKKKINCSIFVQDIMKEDPLFISNTEIIIFLSFLIPPSDSFNFLDDANRVKYIGSFSFSINDQISKLYDVIKRELKLDDSVNNFISFYYGKDIARILSNDASFLKEGISFNGSFIIVQFAPGSIIPQNLLIQFSSNSNDNKKTASKEMQDEIICYDEFENEKEEMTDKYISNWFNSVTFKIYQYQNPTQLLAKFVFRKGKNYSEFKHLFAKKMGFEYNENTDSILFFKSSNFEKKYDENSFNSLLQKHFVGTIYFLIYKCSHNFNESNMFSININFNDKKSSFLIYEEETPGLLLQHLIDNGIIPEKKSDNSPITRDEYRFMVVNNSRVSYILKNTDKFPKDSKNTIFIEKIPKYQLQEGIFLLKVARCMMCEDFIMFFGNPFIIGVKPGEICLQVKERICSLVNSEMCNLTILVYRDKFSGDDYDSLSDDQEILSALDDKDEIFALTLN